MMLIKVLLFIDTWSQMPMHFSVKSPANQHGEESIVGYQKLLETSLKISVSSDSLH